MGHSSAPAACPYCGAGVSLANSIRVYGADYGLLYLCDRYPACDAYVGAHRGTDRPLGTLANAELRSWRNRAHAAFDPLWRDGAMTRKAAYRLMCELLGIERREAHIAMFDVERCKQLIEAIRDLSVNRANHD